MKKISELVIIAEQHPSKGWGYRVELGMNANGQRKRKEQFRRNWKRKDAIAAGNEWLDGYIKNSGQIKKSDGTSLVELCEAYNTFKKTRVKQSSYDTYQAHVGTLRDYFKNAAAAQVTEDDFTKFFNTLSHGFAKTIRSYLSGVYGFGKERGIVRDITTKTAMIPEADPDELPKFLERSELQAFLKQAENELEYRYFALFWLMSHTGIRIGETQALTWNDIKENQLHIRKTLYVPKGGIKEYQRTTPKTGKSYRYLLIDDITIGILNKWQELQNIERNIYPNHFHDTNLIFTSRKMLGYPISGDRIRKVLRRVKDIHPHVLRHTHISLLAQAGATLPEIMDRVGHVDSKVTLKIYLHITHESKVSVMEKYSQLFN